MSVSCCTIAAAWYIHGTYMIQTFLYTFMPGGQDSRWQACSSAKRRAVFTSMADSDPGYRTARATRVSRHNKLSL